MTEAVPTSTSTAPDSPFLPGTKLQYAWDSVSLTAAMSCWRRYEYQILLGLRSKSAGRAIALEFGIAFHNMQECYALLRAQGADHDEAVHQTVLLTQLDPMAAGLPNDDEVTQEAAETPEDDDGITQRNTKLRTRYHLLRAFIWYHEHYRNDPATTLLLNSGKPAVEVSFRLPVGLQITGEDMLLCGHIDRAVEYNNAYYVLDYKTTKGLSKQFFSNFELSHQLTGYTVAGQAIFDKPVAGNIIDGIALQVGGVQFGRHVATRSPGQVEEYFETVQQTLSEAERCHDSGLYPMNTSACYFCDFKEICTKPPEFRKNYINMLYEQGKAWNPLENR